jgi:hypothetical protein
VNGDLLPPDMGDRWPHRPASSLPGWWLTSLVRSITTGWSVRWRRLMTLEYLTALQGLLQSIVDAEELQQQVEVSSRTPVAGASRSPLSVLGHASSLGCSSTRT